MRRSTYCIQAQNDATPNDAVQKKLIDLLNEPIRYDQVGEIRKRADKLVTLFSGLSAKQAASLLTRLYDRNDAVGRLFKCELGTAFRNALIEVLKSRASVADEAQRPAQNPRMDELPSEFDVQPPEPNADTQEPPEPDTDTAEPSEPPEKPGLPEPKDRPEIVIDFKDYFSELLQWILDIRKAANDPRLLEKLDLLENTVKTAIVLLGTYKLVQGMKYYAFSTAFGVLVEIGTKQLEDEVIKRGFDIADVRIRSQVRHVSEFRQLEQTLREITKLTDEIEQELADRLQAPDQSKKASESRQCCPPKAQQLYRGKYTAPVNIDPKLTGMACEIRAKILPDGLSYKAFEQYNIAIAKVDISGRIEYLHAANLPKSLAGSKRFPLHSEGDLTRQIYELKKKNRDVKLLQLYTERTPCPDCKRLLDNYFSEAAVYYTVGKRAPFRRTKAAYLMVQYCVSPPH